MQRQSTAEHSGLLCGTRGMWHMFKTVHLLAISETQNGNVALLDHHIWPQRIESDCSGQPVRGCMTCSCAAVIYRAWVSISGPSQA